MSQHSTAALSTDAVASLRRKLEARREELRAQLGVRLAESEEARESVRRREVHDTKDASFLAALAEVRLAGAAREVQEVRDIEAALARIRGGVYGICMDCGEDIPEARLQAYPTAKRCRPCQEVKERCIRP